MVERGLGVYVPKARSTNSLSMARVCDSCCWSIQLFPRGQCSPVRRALMGLVWIDDGKELLRHSRQSKTVCYAS